MKALAFALAFHNHQPVGNGDSIIERIYRRSYLPFLRALASHPEINANLHYTGFLLDWLERNHPEFVALLQRLVKNGQVEMLGGAFYEPVLSVIPDSDALGQIELLSRKIDSLFGVRPSGIWIAERAWEPQLPELLSKARVDFTMLDDTIFESAGVLDSSCFTPYSVESRGHSVEIFPMQRKLRYWMPFKSIATTISFLRRAHGEGREIALFADDGEKFGAWPTTYDRVFKDGWLDGFFKAVAREQDNGTLATVKLSEYLKENHPCKQTYLPSAAYPEMMEWSLAFNHPKVVENQGFWRLFLSKYPESARIYSKMLWTSKLVHSVRSIPALIELWKGQCNDAYWHGIFGGLYAAILRKTTFEHLIRAQVISEKLRHQGDWISCDKLRRYTIVNTRNLCISISPTLGGSITELDFKPKYVNMFDTLSRRPERYHKQLKLQKATSGRKTVRSIHETPRATEMGLENFLSYDRYDKTSFVDFLVDAETDQESFTRQDFKEVAPFAGQVYQWQIFKQSNLVKAHLERIVQLVSTSISLGKEYKILPDSDQVLVKYSITASNNLSCKFVPELNLGCLADSKFAQNYSRADSTSAGRAEILYPEIGIRAIVRAPKSSKIAMIPIWTVSQSEKGFERNLQGISILPFYELELGRNEKFQAELQFEMKTLRHY